MRIPTLFPEAALFSKHTTYFLPTKLSNAQKCIIDYRTFLHMSYVNIDKNQQVIFKNVSRLSKAQYYSWLIEKSLKNCNMLSQLK